MDRPFSIGFASLGSASLLGLGLAATDLRMVALYVICLVVAVAIHEFAHAWVAHRLGDPTPSRDGRVTLNPLAHADPVGTLLLPAIAGIGWGRPVMTQPQFYTRKISMRAGMALVAFAGPLSNVLQAAVTLGLLKVLLVAGVVNPGLLAVLALFFQLNVLLAAFNLIPVHPLDGGKVLAWLLPPRLEYIDDYLARYGWMVLLALMLIPGLLSPVFEPLRQFTIWALGAIGA